MSSPARPCSENKNCSDRPARGRREPLRFGVRLEAAVTRLKRFNFYGNGCRAAMLAERVNAFASSKLGFNMRAEPR